MEQPKTEIRFVATDLHIREAEEGNEQSRVIEGKAIVYNVKSVVLDDLGGPKYQEIIMPTCITNEFLKTQDVKVNMLHERNQTIARWNKGKGNLNFELREDCLFFSFEAPKCDLGDRCLELVRTGVYTGCSFEFFPKDYEITEPQKDQYLVTHKSFAKLRAITIGMDPAYQQTTVNCREELHGAEELERLRLEKEQALQREVEEIKARARKIARTAYGIY